MARAAAPGRIDVGAVPLGEAIARVAAEAGVTIGIADPGLAAIRVEPFHGRADVARALERMLRGSAAVARSVGDGAYRIERRPIAVRYATPAPAPAVDAIIVTGSKRGTTLSSYPGSVTVVDVADVPMAKRGHGSEALVEQLPILSSTHLGSGRNKLFVRGIADSSFNGPSQGTVGQYLGEARLTYNAPDPDLALYDIADAEVLEGPQGTLYGAGTLGGIVRLDPIMPDLGRFDYGLSLGGSATRRGAPGFDAAALVNLPLARDVVGLRAVAYASDDGGYIDDPERGLRDINRTRTRGGRVELRIRPASGWMIDITGIAQDIAARDGDYAERGLPRLQRLATLPQPFDNDYSLASVTVRHALGEAELTSSTTLVHHDVGSAYDATEAVSSPRLFREQDHILLLTNETRVARHYAGGSSWVLGVEALHNAEDIRRALGPPPDPSPISGSRNEVFEAALYGEATLALSPALSVTGGGRVAYDRLVGEVLDHEKGAPEPNRHGVVFLPSAGVLWRVAPGLSLFARYQEGFRPGGLSVASDAVERYRGDGLSTIEAGARLGDPDTRLQATAAASFARWRHIQADLVGTDGLPFTTNIGNGRVIGLEASLRWTPSRALALSGGLFLNDSSLDDPEPGFAGEKDASLPNVEDLGLQAQADLTLPLAGSDSTHVYAALRYVGGSKLGVGPTLDLPQGHYVVTSAGIRWQHGRIAVSLDVANLLDDGRNQFALGNPFQFALAREITPLRPRTFRLGLSTGF
ncbi:TonB-dependent receptor [Sphingomonas oryzagri]